MDSKAAREEFNVAVDANTTRLLDAFKDIVRGAQINEVNPSAKQLQNSVSAVSIATHCQSLMEQVNLLQMEVILKCDNNSDNSSSNSNNSSSSSSNSNSDLMNSNGTKI